MSNTSTRSSSQGEDITSAFSHRFKIERTRFITTVQGFSGHSEREHYASLLINRLIWAYFLQKQGLLDGNLQYLSYHLHRTQVHQGLNRFYHDFLQRFFYEGLGAPQHSPELQALLGKIPYLGGDLFTWQAGEQCTSSVSIPDSAFTQLFTFFDAYQWSLDEYLPEQHTTITPAIVGSLFEQYITHQQAGTYFTRDDVTAYIAHSTIIPFLFDQVEQVYPQAFQADAPLWHSLRKRPTRYIYEAIHTQHTLPYESSEERDARLNRSADLHARLRAGTIHTIDDLITSNLNICQFALDALADITNPAVLSAFYEQLRSMTILDPTCGTGAFLLAALKTLLPLYEICLSRMRTLSDESDTPLPFTTIFAEVEQYPSLRSFILTSIISNNLYGVDIAKEASEICKLRLLLTLVSQSTYDDLITILQYIKFNVHTGNALIGIVTPEGPQQDDEREIAALRRRLDSSLAKTYDVDPSNTSAFQRWHSSHQPFHWYAEFGPVLRRGGFDVIIGNPPYVKYDAEHFPYTLRDFVTLPCANLYPCVIERCHQLLSPQGRHGMILPLAAFSTKNMIPLLDHFRQWFPCSWLSFYHFRPSMLFSSGKIANIPLAIYLVKASGDEKRFSTHLSKWFTPQRDFLFPSLAYCPVTIPMDAANRHYYPKFGTSLENSLMKKILGHPTVSTYLSHSTNENAMYYRTAGGLYWKVFINFPWPYQTTSNKQCSFQDGYDRDVFVALFNSSLFWWYYTVTFDTFNLKDYALFGFRFSYPEEHSSLYRSLHALCQDLMTDFQFNAKHLKRGQTNSYTFYARKSKMIIDEIDRLLAIHYGFTDAELAFLLNYDRKYRLGFAEKSIEAKKGYLSGES